MVTAAAKICDPALYRLNEAVQKAESAARTSPAFEFEIVRFLQDQCLSDRVPLPMIFRGLEVLGGMLGGTADESRLIPLLRPFLRSGDPRIASKCVLVLGRHCCSTEWLKGVMTETDDRIRGNLVESLWKRKEREVELVLRTALKDPHPRVAANAAWGLYLLGFDAWLEVLDRLISNDIAAFRISGIWLLEALLEAPLESSHAPDLRAKLKLLIRDADADVRRAAFKALIHLREYASKKTPTDQVA